MSTPADDAVTTTVPPPADASGPTAEPWARLLVAMCMSYVDLKVVGTFRLKPASRLCREGESVMQLLGELESRGYVRDVAYTPPVEADYAAGEYHSESDEVNLVITPEGDRAARELIAALPSAKRDLVLLAAYAESSGGRWRGWFAPGCLPLSSVNSAGEVCYQVHWRDSYYLAHQLCKLGDFDVKAGASRYRLTRRGVERAKRLVLRNAERDAP